MHQVDYSNEFLEAPLLVFDIETKDPELSDKGPSTFRGTGYILGIGLATESGRAEYYDIAHPNCTNDLRQKNLDFLSRALRRECIKVGANIRYDLEWVELSLGMHVGGMLYDIQIAENLLDENKRKYNLESLAQKYLNKGKNTSRIQMICDYNNWKGAPQEHLWKMDYSDVRDYVLDDVLEPLEIIKIQLKLLEEQDLIELFNMECKIHRVLNNMRKNGVKIDADKRDRNALLLQNKMEQSIIDMRKQYGNVNVKSSLQVSKILDKLQIEYPITDKGNPSITAEYLKAKKDDVNFLDQVYNIRKIRDILGGFLLGAFTEYITPDGLLHCQFFNTKTDNFGTKSGRFSSARPNLQQVPSKGVDEYYGQICREIFIPYEDWWWVKFDYSQIEYRCMAHFAVGPGSEEVRLAYNTDAAMDYHQYIMDLTGLKRRFAKNLNFGVAYGMGAKHMAEFFNWPIDYCYDILRIYHSKAPFIKATVKEVENVAKRRGYIRTVLGRKARLIDKDKAYTMFCRLNQGSAADIMKKAMVDIYDAGLMDFLKFHLTVHDELDLSAPKTKKGIEALKETKYIMENCVQLDVPIKSDFEIGTSWADLKEMDINELTT